MRGEQCPNSLPTLDRVGSPPLARGTVIGHWYANREAGITPACAGNRTATPTTPGIARDHPRLRGEQLGAVLVRDITQGSPPLARGTVSHRYRSRRNGGDHPRLRGEQRMVLPLNARDMGSPPLARGTVNGAGTNGPLGGITPACAGNSVCRSRTASRS